MKKLTKKMILAAGTLLIIVGMAYADEGFNMSAGAGAAVSAVGKVYAYEDVNFDYEFANGIALGGGVKVHENLTQKTFYNSNGEITSTEAFVYTMPYLMFKAGHFTMEGGVTLSSDTTPVYENFYARLGGDFPIWECGKGKFGLDFGIETWMSLVAVETPESDGSGESAMSSALAAGFGSLFSTIFNIPKISVGVKYYLPI